MHVLKVFSFWFLVLLCTFFYKNSVVFFLNKKVSKCFDKNINYNDNVEECRLSKSYMTATREITKKRKKNSNVYFALYVDID